MKTRRAPDQGVILINVLVILALSSTILFAMLRLSETAITRSQQFSDASQATALLNAGEITAMAALRRDMQEAPQVDHPGEDWAAIAQEDVAIEGGSFSLAIADASGKFNLTNLRQATPEAALFLQKILSELGFAEATRLQILSALARPTPMTTLYDIGLSPAEVASLETLVTVLPKPSAINLNTTPDAMFGVLAGNPVQARLLQGIRQRTGQLSTVDLLNAGLIPQAQVDVTSAFFTVTTRVTIGDITLARESLLARSLGPFGPEVMVIARHPVE